MATFTISIDTVKKYFAFFAGDSNSDQTTTNLNTYLTNALVPAQDDFKASIGIDNYLNYVNTPSSIDFTVVEINSDGNHVLSYDNTDFIIEVNDLLYFTDSLKKVISINDDGDEITINGVYSGSDTSFSLGSIKSMENIYAWIVLYNFTFTAQELLIKYIIEQNKEFGDGEIQPAYDPLLSYRNQLKNNIDKALKSLSLNKDINTSSYIEYTTNRA